jgi:uncharacterized protein (TIGR03435 family)
MSIVPKALRAVIGASAVAGALFIVLFCARYGRAQATRPEFEAASIKLHQGAVTKVDLAISGPRVTVDSYDVGSLITDAYSLRDYQLLGGAEWTRSEPYDIVAKAEGDGTPTMDQVRLMLQTLLESRFNLKAHRETREMQVYALVTGKSGPKLKEVESADDPLLNFGNEGRGAQFTFSNAPVEFLIRQLPRMPGVDRPVLDKTGLSRHYDFKLYISDFQLSLNAEHRGIPAADAEGPSIFTALQEQLGLKLESQKAPVEVLVVDHVDRPSGN